MALDLGIIVTGTGINTSIVCNKIKGIRAALVHDIYLAQMCRQVDDKPFI